MKFLDLLTWVELQLLHWHGYRVGGDVSDDSECNLLMYVVISLINPQVKVMFGA